MAIMKSTILTSEVVFREQPFAKPLQLSSGTITEITEATVTVRVRVGGVEAEGRGCIYLSDLWAWPDAGLSHAERDAAMRAYCERLAGELPGMGGARHPLSHGMAMLERNAACRGDVPFLAGSVCLSPFDAAVHDAVGRAVGRSAFRLYETGMEDDEAAGVDQLGMIRRMLLAEPVARVDGWYVVSGTDPLEEDFRKFVVGRGFRAFKLKTHGKDPEADARRTVEVFAAARALGVAFPRLSADSNEGNPDSASVGAYLDVLEAMDGEAYAALEYLEQPTGRDIRQHAFEWGEIGRRKPVLVDEGLMEPGVLPVIAAQGWSGICLKTCKGHSFNLVAGAWAHARGMRLAVQDLTNPGVAAVHSCLLAQHVPTVNGVELNSPQFTPAANEGWAERMPGLFVPEDGRHGHPEPLVAGLGGMG
jgi:L-alanine-DL-glutamate epimerase-like enolase superfamily enzyme